MNPVSILKKYYGYDHFRPGQKELIEAILAGRDALGIMPTGGGKSICYQIPALLLEGITIVISPLISLMKDQVDTLKEYGIPAELINSTLSMSEFRDVIDRAKLGEYKLLYIAPERLETESFVSLVESIPIDMIAIDEAHCISQWGHDFRPSYNRIKIMIEKLPKRPIIAAFTATATPLVKSDIKTLLDLYEPFELLSSFDRSNLYFEVRKPDNKLHEIQSYLKAHSNQSGIIYCATRKNVDEVCERLNKLGISATKYHAGLNENERTHNQEDFLFDRVPIIVATNAFGMGIDKPNVRFVIHYNMPKNMESYYQEAGRAGRDGEESECILLYSTQDIMTNRYLIDIGNTSGRVVEYEKLNSMVDYCNTEGCLRGFILNYFSQQQDFIQKSCDYCGNCNNDIEKTDITIEAQKILSCVKRMEERFGASQVADVLKGANTQKIRSLNFDQLSTYGIMEDYPKDTIKELISFLIAEGYLHLVGTQYPLLQLTQKSYLVLKGEQKVFIKRIIIKEDKKKYSVEIDSRIDDMLFEVLRKIRQKIALDQHIQPFMILSDKTLKEMARSYPITLEEMLDIAGIGEYKINKYGDIFLQEIKSYVAQYPERVKENKLLFQKKADLEKDDKVHFKKGTARNSHKTTYELYKEGYTLDQIADRRELSRMTIENHLVKCIHEGLEINYKDFIPTEYEEQIIKAIEQHGVSLLKPIKESLPEDVGYTAIKFAVARYSLNNLV